jgi:predicted amidohydrolase
MKIARQAATTPTPAGLTPPANPQARGTVGSAAAFWAIRTAARRRWVMPCLATLLVCFAAWAQPPGDAPQRLTVGIAQVALEPTLAANRDKLIGMIRQARTQHCRVVVFPETALYPPPGTAREAIDAAVAELAAEAARQQVYVLLGGLYWRQEGDKPFERLLVIDPRGQVLLTYHKLWSDARFQEAPDLFWIDGIPCAAILCADRWLRGVEDLPVMAGAKILFECSNNYANEWIDELAWYWYVPRALRSGVYVVFANTAPYQLPREGAEPEEPAPTGHGHSAVFAPDGRLVAALDTQRDRLLVATLDLSQATAAAAHERRQHPLLAPFWQTGLTLRDRATQAPGAHQPLTSPAKTVTLAAGQMVCSRRIDVNLKAMQETILEAAAKGADLIAFPELALTGADEADLRDVSPQRLAEAQAALAAAARAHRLYVVYGTPWAEGGQWYNAAVVLSPQGDVRTRYFQIAAPPGGPFAPGRSTRAMWFDLDGVPAVVTIGRDALWSELAEMAAWRGALVHVHLAYATEASPEGRLVQRQLWANLASFRTFTVTVNAARGEVVDASLPGSGGSALWEDFHRGAGKRAGGFAPHSAVRLAEAGEGPALLVAAQEVPEQNPLYRIVAEKGHGGMAAWYASGAAAIFREVPAGAAAPREGRQE